MSAKNDRNLVLAALAIQLKLATREQVATAMTQWLDQSDRTLLDILAETASLGQGEVAMLTLAVENWLDRHQSGDWNQPTDRHTVSSGPSSHEAGPIDLGNQSVFSPDRQPSSSVGEGRRFQILRKHAGGGLGEVFVARDQEISREVALKQIRDKYADDAELRARFVLEAQITGGLEHPGVVPVYSFGCDAKGRPFYAMRFIRGESLHDAIKQHRDLQRDEVSSSGQVTLSLRKLLTSFVALCHTMAYVHSRGVIHRDIKPDNVMLGPYGETLVVDWGLAKIIGRSETKSAATVVPDATLRPEAANSPTPTQLGSAIGTPAYMSPEQAAGLVDQLTAATDIYSLGATLYAILTGHAPVAHDQPRMMLNEVILGRYPRPRQLEPDAPRELESICLKAMARDPAARYATAQAMAADIEAWLAGEPVSAYRERWFERLRRWRRRHPRLVSGAAAALAAAAISLGVGSIFLHEAKRMAEDREREARQNFHLARAAVDQYLTRIADDARLQEADLEQLRNDLLAMAQKFYEQLIQIRPEEAGLQYDHTWAQSRLARIARQLGRLKDAINLMDRAEDQFAALVAKEPANEQFRGSLAKCRGELGLWLIETGDTARAESLLREGITALEKLAAERTDNPDYKIDLANLHENLAKLAVDTRQYAKGETAYRTAIQCRSEVKTAIEKRGGDATRIEVDLARSQIDLGKLLHRVHRNADAAESLESARKTLRRLAKEFPDRFDYRVALADACDALGQLNLESPDRLRPPRFDEAEADLLEALSLRKRLVEDHPRSSQFRRDLAQSHNNAATLYDATDRLPEAELMLLAARELQERLAEQYPELPEHKKNLATTLSNLGILYSDTRRPAESLAASRKAIQILQDLADRFPDQPENRRGLAAAYGNLASEFAASDRQADARDAYRSAARILEALVEKYPDIPDDRASLAAVLVHLAAVECALGQNEPALENCRRAITILDQMPDAKSPTIRDTRYKAFANGAAALQKLGRFTEALKQWNLAVEASPKLARDRTRLGQAECLAAAGENDRAIAEIKSLLSAASGIPDVLQRMARVAAKAADPAMAVKLVGESLDADALRRAERIKAIENDPALESLRNRDDYRRAMGK